jgi:hypothetical protein
MVMTEAPSFERPPLLFERKAAWTIAYTMRPLFADAPIVGG